MSKENLSSKRRKSLVTLGENCGKNTEIAVEECDPPSSRKSLRLQGPSGISLSPEILKTSEYSSEKFGKTPGDDHTAKVRHEKTLQSNRTCFHERSLPWFCFNFFIWCIAGEDETRKRERVGKNEIHRNRRNRRQFKYGVSITFPGQ